MGLLDDAIREHFELRRRHGADPSEVLSKEQEALGPAATRAGDASPAEGEPLFATEPSLADGEVTGGHMTAEDRRRERREADRDADDPYLSQETVELDMRAVLDEDASVGDRHAARGGMRSMTTAPPLRALR
jgi:hypothetical protein